MADFRSLCARMADELDHYRQLLMDDRRETHALAVEARAALAEPQPPADGEVGELVAWLLCITKHFRRDGLGDEADRTHRAAELLERLSDGPAVQSREPASVVEEPGDVGPTLDDIWELCEEHEFFLGIDGANESESAEGLLQITRAVLSRWGSRGVSRCHRLQQENHRFREPERTILCDILANGCLLPDADGKRYGIAAPQPIPVTERLPEAGDCDAEGRCWFNAYDHNWLLEDRTYGSNAARSHWLPAHALPLPEDQP